MGEELSQPEKPTRLWRLPIGARFEDYSGKQIFEKVGEYTVVKTRQKMHALRCEKSPYTKLPGPITAAFFCAIGQVVYRGGSLFLKEAA